MYGQGGNMSNSIGNKFDVMERMVSEVAGGNCQSLIVSGPPGVGKTFLVTKTLRNYSECINPLLGGNMGFDCCSGTMTPINLYKFLYKNRSKDSVLVFDDMDSVFNNETSLNLLKAALDLNANKTIGYYSESHVLRKENIPNEFVFEGSVIFLTNIDFKTGPKSLQVHFDALLSRSHYIDIGMRTTGELMNWVFDTIKNTDMLDNHTEEDRQNIISYMIDHKDELNEISLRMVKKLANLSKMGEGWQDIANITCLSN